MNENEVSGKKLSIVRLNIQFKDCVLITEK